MESGNIMDGDAGPVQRHNPLEQFVLLAKGTRGAACCDLIKNVLEAPGVYVFAELIALSSIKEVYLIQWYLLRSNLSFAWNS